MRIGRIASICAVVSFSLLNVGNPILADQTDSNAQPYGGGRSLICTVTFGKTGKPVPVLISPLSDTLWIGWIWPAEHTGYVLEPIRLSVEQNDAEGIKLVGGFGPFDVRVFVSAAKPNISVVRSIANSSHADYGSGDCGLPDDDEYTLAIEKKSLD